MTNKHASALGKLGRARNSKAQQEASRVNGKLGGRPAVYRCPCGATGRDISRWKYAGGMKTKCKQCGRSE